MGSLVGAFIAAKIASNYKIRFALAIGICYLIGGTINIFLLPSPRWFIVVDLAGAYIPMAYLAGRLALRKKKNKN